MVGGYVRKCVALRISSRVESCCIGIRDQPCEFVESYKLSPSSSSCSSCFSPSPTSSPSLTEKIGPPLITLRELVTCCIEISMKSYRVGPEYLPYHAGRQIPIFHSPQPILSE